MQPLIVSFRTCYINITPRIAKSIGNRKGFRLHIFIQFRFIIDSYFIYLKVIISHGIAINLQIGFINIIYGSTSKISIISFSTFKMPIISLSIFISIAIYELYLCDFYTIFRTYVNSTTSIYKQTIIINTFTLNSNRSVRKTGGLSIPIIIKCIKCHFQFLCQHTCY